VATEKFESQEFPGVIEVRRRHYFDAVVNQDAGRSKLSQIGIPGERPFQTSTLPADDILWVWAEEADCQRLGVEVQIEPMQTDATMMHKFRAIPANQLRGGPLEGLLRKYGFNRPSARVSERPPRTVARFAGEVSRGQLRLWERKASTGRRPSQLSPGLSEEGGELMLLEECLILRLHSSKGNFLVASQQTPGMDGEESKWSLLGPTRKVQENGYFPEVRLKNGEDRRCVAWGGGAGFNGQQ
ncbi:unnamed protein product, partial [Symbiodinium pilosum]